MRETLEKKVYYCKKNDISYAGTHLLIDIRNAKNISCPDKVAVILKNAVKSCGATLLKLHTHTFTPYDGVSGIAILQESHIAIHTWPELKYAAVDIFVCGNIDPYNAVPVFKEAFDSDELQVMEMKRGIFDERQLVF